MVGRQLVQTETLRIKLGMKVNQECLSKALNPQTAPGTNRKDFGCTELLLGKIVFTCVNSRQGCFFLSKLRVPWINKDSVLAGDLVSHKVIKFPFFKTYTP